MAKILAISGSLRARSSNTEVLRAAAALAPRSLTISLYAGLATLPHFNPDLDREGDVPPEAVQDLRARVGEADGLLICSPEYAHGVPGALKNALDWLVSGPEIVGKPIGLLNASPRSTHAHESLAETLRTMTCVLVAGASVALPLNGRRLDADRIAADPDLSKRLRAALDALAVAIHSWPGGSSQRRRDMVKPAKNTICLWYDGDAEDAARFYAKTFPDSSVGAVHRAPGDFPSGKKGDVLTVEFTVMGIPCLGLNGGPAFKHNEAFSFQVATADQAETDRYWNAIIGNGGQESACGWCKDKWGLSWQITPIVLTKAVTDRDTAAAKRAFDAMMQMKKIDIAAIEAAHRG
jgi:predicted 3-demethylubiquinone-9 3-methyltransferase (glyoxalase superfamily)/NAD(P)H-dependent FMN reductase